jgi:hypothetical protein
VLIAACNGCGAEDIISVWCAALEEWVSRRCRSWCGGRHRSVIWWMREGAGPLLVAGRPSTQCSSVHKCACRGFVNIWERPCSQHDPTNVAPRAAVSHVAVPSAGRGPRWHGCCGNFLLILKNMFRRQQKCKRCGMCRCSDVGGSRRGGEGLTCRSS